MVQRQDYVALEWVKSEIDETLLQARGVLETFVENTEDVAQLRFCLMHIHQVSGTLQMVQFFGAALLGEEMEHFCNAIVDGTIPPDEDNLSLLMQGILQLPNYLERVKVAKKDLPTVLLPLINQFRKVRGAADLSEVVFFRPDFRNLFADLRDVDYRRFDDPRFIELVRKLRQMYQFSLIGLLRGEDLEKNWSHTLKVIDKLADVTKGTPAGQLWFLCAALVEGLSTGSIAFNIHAKKLLKSLEKVLRQLSEGKSAKLHDRPDYELLRHSLFLVSESQGVSPRIQKVRDVMGLATPDNAAGVDSVGTPDKETMTSVVEALLEELVKVKDSLDILVRGKVHDINSLAALVPNIKYIADTMAMVGLKVPQRMLLEQIDVLNTVVASDEAPDDATLMNVAGAILYVEASLVSSLTRKGIYGLDDSASPRLEGAFEAVIHEARNGLEQSKDSITEFISGQFDQKFLKAVPGTLTTISGGLHMIQLEKASQILLACVRYVNDKLISEQHKPDWEELDVLADALMGVEYYLERITQDGEHTNEKWLQQAQNSTEKLGYRLSDNWEKRQAAEARQAALETEVPPAAEAVPVDVDAVPVDSTETEASDNDLSVVAPADLDTVELDTVELDADDVEPVEDDAVDQDTVELDVVELDVVEDDAVDRDTADDSPVAESDAETSEVAFTEDDVADAAPADLDTVEDDAVDRDTADDASVAESDAETSEVAVTEDDVADAAPADLDAVELDTVELDAVELDTVELDTVDGDAVDLDTVELDTVDLDTVDDVPVAESDAEVIEPSLADEAATLETEDLDAVELDTVAADDNDDLIDDEIIEIFLEEAAEVLETIAEYLPKFVRNENDDDALAEVRRAFHTLKGSGRMVGASVSAELAWSIENMLNRLLDGTVNRSHDMMSVIDQVVALLPDLIEDFRTSQSPDRPEVAHLTHMAEMIAKGTWEGEAVEVASLVVTSDAPEIDDDAAITLDDNDAIDSEDADLATLDWATESSETVESETDDDGAITLDDNDAVDDEYADLDALALMDGQLPSDSDDDAIEIDETLDDDTDLADLEALGATSGAVAIELDQDDGDDWSAALSQRLLGNDDEISVADIATDSGDADDSGDLESLVPLLSEEDSISFDADAGSEIADATFADDASDADDALPVAVIDDTESDDADDALPVAVIEDTESEDVESDDDDSGDLDASLIAIFKGELEIHLRQVESNLSEDFSVKKDIKIRGSLQRTLNTIQGSAQAASFTEIAQVSLAAELLVKDCIARNVCMDESIADSLRGMVTYIRSALDASASEELSRECQNCLAGLYIVHQHKLSEFEIVEDDDEHDVMSLFMSANMDVILDAEHMVSHWNTNGHSTEDISVLTRGLHELAVSADRIRLRPISQLSDALIEYYHNLGAYESPVDNSCYAIALEAQEQLINMIDRLAAGQSLKFSTQVETELAEKQAWLIEQENLAAAEKEAQHAQEAIAAPDNTDQAGEREWVDIDTDPDLLEIFLDEAQDILETILMDYQQWKSDPSSHKVIGGLQRSLHTMKGGARMANIAPIGNLSHELETLYEGLYEGRFHANAEMFAMVEQCHDTLGDMIDDVIHEGRCRSAAHQVSLITAYAHRLWANEQTDDEHTEGLDDLQRILGSDDGEESHDGEVSDDGDDHFAAALLEDADVTDVPDVEQNLTETSEDAVVVEAATPEPEPETPAVPADDSPLADLAVDLSTDIDPDILEIFLDEANELLHDLDSLIHAWQDSPVNDEVGDNLKRVLHTLKGGARLAKLTTLGDKSHEFETYVIHYLRDHARPDANFFKEIIRLNDELVMGLERLEKGLAEKADAPAQVEPEVVAPVEPEAQAVVPVMPQVADTQEATSNEVNRAAANKSARKARQRARGNQPQETVKVNASLLENLVNLAGETSITRSRLEQEVSDFGYTLVDMEATIDRLRDQVRRLDIETEEQMTFRQERAEESNYVDFDPLEMDRYSSMQQLSRSLMEAASDLYDFKGSLADKARDAETILLQQARINTQLHEGLMQTRMVPFNRLVPRLRRIVRQISDETHKNVDLIIHHADGELDRTVLEHMVSPLEHILRNAVDHGIEMPSDRTAKGKNAKGRIDLTLSRESGEAIITIADDGAGINIDKVRKKAIEKGLIHKNQEISDQDVLQFILSSGFTTAERVTQISGRGVGMDVVHSEVRALGGTISIDTESGSGTNFVIRLPVNVSVSRALMVNLGDDLYAIPLDSIEGIVRVQSQDVAVYLHENAPAYAYAGTDYRVQYLGELLGADRAAGFQADGQAIPLILAKQSKGKESIAFYVDNLLGSKEIVVKPLGPQFTGVRSLSGATILGDGSVVVILDLISMLRLDMTIGQKSAADLKAISKKEKRLKKVLIVDDSVTVRKVTTRLLERNGMEPKTAKDGADAILILQEYTPDLILLDIEMPRMDGFEVAQRVRHDPNLKDIPIIMITSRTGDKHRERAFSIGVNAYMGKPFQEGPLLAKIKALIDEDKAE